MWICFIYTIKERCKLCGYVLYIQLTKGVSCVKICFIYIKGVSCNMFYTYTIKERCKLCGYVLYIQLSGVSCVECCTIKERCKICFIYTIKERCKLCDMFYIYN